MTGGTGGTGGTGRPGRVLVVGDLVTDVVAVLDGSPVPAGAARRGHRAVPAGGSALPLAPGSDTPARIRVTGGGQAANTAAWLARDGVPVTLVAAVGADPAGRERVAELAAAGVDCAVRRVAGAATGTLVVLSGPGGTTGTADRTMVTDRGAADQLRPADIDAALARWDDARHLHLSGYALLGDGSRPAGRHALATAGTGGLTTSVAAASTDPLRRVGPARFRSWLRGVDLLLANADEAAVLGLPGTGPTAPAAVPTGGEGAVVVTHGSAGADWTSADGEVARVDAVPGAVVDPTGAGDAFAAGLLAAWLAGAGPAGALRAGVRCGAEAVATVGARPPVPPA